jgi:polyisoprenoid-binding protein YceI
VKTTNVFIRTKWKVDPAHSNIGFKVKHLKFSNLRGKFKEYDSNIYTNGEDFMTAQIDFWLDPASVDTGDEKRDAHLKSIDFFNVDNFKVINFCVTRYVKSGEDNKYDMYGDLTMKGVKKEIKLNVGYDGMIKDSFGNDKAIFNMTGQINRKNWGLNWNAALESGGVLVSEDVWIECQVQLIKQL